jgi:hypothetical protein
MTFSQYLYDWFAEDIRRVPITPITLRHISMEFWYSLADKMGAAVGAPPAASYAMPEIDNVISNRD